ncbi:MAG: alpha/beta hydrolase [Coleofasciculus sp. D1-CHI-01]|uniref:alpha/beta hydrolase n=1 Tax=Coleofasciculus sp. D1-CHI-01 TaxID=3068482 RepID=UPI0032F63B70
MSNYLSNLRHFLYSGIIAVGVWSYSWAANASESVVLKYRFLRETISVPELSTFAQTGELSRSLQAYLDLAGKQPEELRTTLTQPISVNGIMLSRILNTPVGEVMLDRVSEVIHTPTNRANRQSLRSALVISALNDNQITLIEILDNYPTADVHVEGDRLADILQQITRLSQGLPPIDLF